MEVAMLLALGIEEFFRAVTKVEEISGHKSAPAMAGALGLSAVEAGNHARR
jgi:hypothetical protein